MSKQKSVESQLRLYEVLQKKMSLTESSPFVWGFLSSK